MKGYLLGLQVYEATVPEELVKHAEDVRNYMHYIISVLNMYLLFKCFSLLLL